MPLHKQSEFRFQSEWKKDGKRRKKKKEALQQKDEKSEKKVKERAELPNNSSPAW